MAEIEIEYGAVGSGSAEDVTNDFRSHLTIDTGTLSNEFPLKVIKSGKLISLYMGVSNSSNIAIGGRLFRCTLSKYKPVNQVIGLSKRGNVLGTIIASADGTLEVSPLTAQVNANTAQITTAVYITND